jgi:hypothetical protein
MPVPLDNVRQWGDGATDGRVHVILDASFEPDFELIWCGPCDMGVGQGEFLSLDRAWAHHRGLVYHTPRYGALATDEEVSEFLRRVENPQARAEMAGSFSTLSNPEADIDHAWDLMNRLTREREEALHAL